MADESDLPPLPWSTTREARRAERAERRRERHERRDGRGADKGRREPLQPNELVDAAIRILDSEGLDALTVRRLAAELGTGVMTLYWYVQNKDEILDLVADRVTAEVEIPEPGPDWKARVRMMAMSLRNVLLRHPAAVPIVDQRPTLGPNALRLMDAALGILREAGFSEQDSADGYFLISSYVTGFVAWQTATVKVASQSDVSRREFGRMALDYVSRLPLDRYPNLVALGDRIFGGSLDGRFSFGIETVLDGLSSRLEATRTP